MDLWNGTAAQLNGFKNSTGTSYPLLLNGATATGGNVQSLYGTYDNYVVISKQGIVRYHAALSWPHGNRYQLGEIRGAVDSLVSPTLDVPPAGRAGLSLAVAPNPVRGRTTLTLSLPHDEERVRVTVHDLAGREVAELWSGFAPAGVTALPWDARGRDGGALAAGVYLVRAVAGAEARGLRLVVIR